MTAIALTNPKYAHNVGAAIRACSCWEVDRLIWSGDRVPLPQDWYGKSNEEDEQLRPFRMPREERMKGYAHVKLEKTDRFKDIINEGHYTPIAVELRENSENLFDFIHPENGLYIFGPEDGGLERRVLQHCHRFITIPTAFCLNLGAAVNVILAHRAFQIYKQTGYLTSLKEKRGF